MSVDHDAVRATHGFHPLRVVELVDETADARSFRFDIPTDAAELFRYRAGQFCTFRFSIDGVECLRSYSMSSAPDTDDALTITVKRVPGGLVSNWMHDHVAVGDVLEATRPAGVFVAAETVDARRPIVAFGGGSGITPVLSIAKSTLNSGKRPVRLLCANRDAASVIFAEVLERLAVDHSDRFDLAHHLDAESGYLSPVDLDGFLGDDLAADFYICGPTPFMDLVEAHLLSRGVDPSNISIERFINAGQNVAEVAATSQGQGEAEGQGEGGDGGDGEVTATVNIILKGKRTEIAYQPGDTILETSRRGGLLAPFSCEAGNCATCMALVTEGSATMRVNNALTPEEVAEGWVLTCQALPQGPVVTVEYENF